MRNLNVPTVHKIQESTDGTCKFLLKLEDGALVEAVLLHFHKKRTLCLSSQVGCAMKCTFCFTGTQGLKRHLQAHEIVGQHTAVWNWVKERHGPRSHAPAVVFMGQGEPLHNFEAVKEAIALLMSPKGAHLGHRQITLSTAGYGPGMQRLNELPPVNLAFSLHSPFETERAQLMPISAHWPLQECMRALDARPLLKRQSVMYEYSLLKGVNDTKAHADGLAKLLSGRAAMVNLIPFNPFPGSPYQRPSQEEVAEFKALLVERGIRAMARLTKGDDVMAACGQLNTKAIS